MADERDIRDAAAFEHLQAEARERACLAQADRLRRIAEHVSESGQNKRSEVLRTAESLVNGARNTQYDEPSADFRRTAGMWSAYLGIPIEMHDVAALMALLKVARIRHMPSKLDSWVDLAGYAACGADVADAHD